MSGTYRDEVEAVLADVEQFVDRGRANRGAAESDGAPLHARNTPSRPLAELRSAAALRQ